MEPEAPSSAENLLPRHTQQGPGHCVQAYFNVMLGSLMSEMENYLTLHRAMNHNNPSGRGQLLEYLFLFIF